MTNNTNIQKSDTKLKFIEPLQYLALTDKKQRRPKAIFKWRSFYGTCASDNQAEWRCLWLQA